MMWLVLSEGTGREVGETIEVVDDLLRRHWLECGVIGEPPVDKAPKRARIAKDDA